MLKEGKANFGLAHFDSFRRKTTSFSLSCIIGQFSKIGIWSRRGLEVRTDLERLNPTKRSLLRNSSTLIVKTRLVSGRSTPCLDIIICGIVTPSKR